MKNMPVDSPPPELEKHCVALNIELLNYKLKNSNKKAKIQHLKKELRKLRESIIEQEHLYISAIDQANRGEERLQAVLNSTVWRISTPLRVIAEHCPVSIRRLVRRILKLSWWLLTPWRIPQRLRVLRARNPAQQHQDMAQESLNSNDRLTSDIQVTEAFRIFRQRQNDTYE